MIADSDRAVLDAFAARVREIAPSAAVWAFGSRARGTAVAESDLDVCIVVAGLTRAMRDAIRDVAWETGFELDRVLSTVILSRENFEHGPMAASTLVANIRRDGVAA